MRHSASRALYQHWNALRGDRPAPERAEIAPEALRKVLADTLMLDLDAGPSPLVRLAGTRICGLFARELRGTAFDALFLPTERERARSIVQDMAAQAQPTVVRARGHTADGRIAHMELLLLPLALEGRTEGRALGSIGALTVPYWVGLVPIEGMAIIAARRVPRPAHAVPAIPLPGGMPPRLTLLRGGRP